MQGWRRIGLGVFWVLICGSLAACGSALYYQVRPGDTLSEIGQRYGVSYQEIARYNTIANPDKLEVGQRLRIPPPTQPQIARPAPSENRVLARAVPEKLPTPGPPLSEGRAGGTSLFSWPVEGQITSMFGPRNGSFHDGLDIAAPRGTAVLAAADGQVIFSDVLRGYGNVVIVRHPGGYVTVYAHNQTNLVKEGQAVRRGEQLAEVGQSGRATGASVHFEVRKDNLARDPLHYLPQDQRTVRKEPSP
ncbi:MAG: M23 family metallopeptidase [Deltaproteobacteria bacterium]|nr:M23 family metallopeptidase [Deltaproteobacteria bacterium]